MCDSHLHMRRMRTTHRRRGTSNEKHAQWVTKFVGWRISNIEVQYKLELTILH